MLSYTKLRITKDTKPLKGYGKLVVLQIGDIAEIDPNLNNISVSDFNGKLRVSVSLGIALISADAAEGVK